MYCGQEIHMLIVTGLGHMLHFWETGEGTESEVGVNAQVTLGLWAEKG